MYRQRKDKERVKQGRDADSFDAMTSSASVRLDHVLSGGVNLSPAQCTGAQVSHICSHHSGLGTGLETNSGQMRLCATPSHSSLLYLIPKIAKECQKKGPPKPGD